MEKSHAIDSEIALTAFLATTVSVTQVPEFGYGQLISILGVALLFTTFTRRILLFENKSSNSKWMMLSNPVLYVCSSISIIYLLYGLSVYISLSSLLPLDWQPLIFSLTVYYIGFFCLLIRPNITIYEINDILGGYRKKKDSEITELIVSPFQKRIRREKQQSPSLDDPAVVFQIMRYLIYKIIAMGIVGILMYYFVSELYQLYVYLVLALGIFAVYVFVGILYSRYGVLRYKELIGNRLSIRLNIIGLLITCIFGILVA